jgi:hypothetical protein
VVIAPPKYHFEELEAGNFFTPLVDENQHFACQRTLGRTVTWKTRPHFPASSYLDVASSEN